MGYVREALGQSTTREVAAHFLRGAAELTTRYPDRTGCIGVHGVLAGSDDAERIRRALIEYRAAGEAALRERFERAKAEGDLPDTADCATLAAYVMAVTHGLAVQAKAGFSREVLQAVAGQALAGWPADPRSAQAAGGSAGA